MATTPEIERKGGEGQNVEEILEEMTPIEKAEIGEQQPTITPTPTNFTAQVTDDAGNPLIQTPQTSGPSIQIPADPAQLTAASQGSPDDSIAWFATYWIRMIKKAIHFGWNVLMGK